MIPESSPKIIEGWKGIAQYFAKDTRTVQRWERREGLPVRRHQHSALGSVYAIPEELDKWKLSRALLLEPAPPAEEPPVEDAPDDVAPPRDEASAAPGELPPTDATARPVRREARPRRGLVAIWGVTAAVVSLAAFGINSMRTIPPRVPTNTGRLFARMTAEHAQVRFIEEGGVVADRLAVLRSRGELWAPEGLSGTLKIYDTRTLRLGASIPLEAATRPSQIQVAPDESFVYILGKSGRIFRVDAANRQVRVIEAARRVDDIALTPDGRRLYIAAVFEGLLAMDTGTLAVTPLETTPAPCHLALHGPSGRLYVAYRAGGPGGRKAHDTIEVRDAATGAPLGMMQGPPLVGSY